MTHWIAIELGVLVALLACSAFCSSAESAFFSLNPLDLRKIDHKHPRRGARVHEVLRDPRRLLATLLIGNTIVNTAASAVAYSIAAGFFPAHGTAIAVGAMTAVLLIFGEIGPKRVGLLRSQTIAVLYASILPALMRVATPLRVGLEAITRRCESVFHPRRPTLSHEEYTTVLEIGSEEGILNDEELGMVKAVIRLDGMTVVDVMTPRVDVVGLDVTEDTAAAVKVAATAKVNFLLLYRDTLDNIEALLDVRKFLLDPEHRVEKAKAAPMYVPESLSLTRLLAQFQKERKRIAVVVDEYGGTAGIVTRGDILEEIAGDVFEEMSKPRPVFQQAGPYRWLVDANFGLAELNRKLHLRLHSDTADRLAGWIAEQTGHVPQPNEVVETPDCRVTVLQTRRHRVTLAQIEKTEAAT